MDVIVDLIQYLHYHLGVARTTQLLVTIGILVGLLIGLMGMFLFIAFISTRIRRDDKFPLKDRINTLNFEIGGKRITAAPHPKTIKESMQILLDAMVWTLFKRKPIHYKSILKSKVVFCTTISLVMVLVLGSFVSTSDAFVENIRHNPHYISWAKSHKKNRPTQQEYQLASAHTESVAPTAPLKQEKTQSNPEKNDTKKAVQNGQPGDQSHTYLKEKLVERRLQILTQKLPERPVRIEVASSRSESNTAVRIQISQSGQSNPTSQTGKPVMRLVQEVTSDGRQIVQSVSQDKVVNTVTSALSSGVKQITIK